MDDDMNMFLKAGADAVMAKPLTTDQLDQILLYIKTNGCQSVFESKSVGKNDNIGNSVSRNPGKHRLYFADGSLVLKSL